MAFGDETDEQLSTSWPFRSRRQLPRNPDELDGPFDIEDFDDPTAAEWPGSTWVRC